MSPQAYALFFVGKSDPRDGCVVIGEDVKPVFFRFETPAVRLGDARTTIYRNGEVVALFDWTMSTHFGLATINSRQLPMSQLVMPGTVPRSRVFVSSSGERYEWRSTADREISYTLYKGSSEKLATFCYSSSPSPVGPTHAFMRYIFQNEALLLEALLALALNRWLDSQGY